jgi:C4-dicarboxylate-specific signal transduction histidine kinase
VRAHIETKNQRDSLSLATDKFSYTADIEKKEHQLLKAEKDRIAKQSAMIHSGRLSAIGEMAACMAHEIGNPLNAISIILQKWEMRLNNDKLDAEIIKKDINELKGNVERITRLTSQIRTFGRARENMTRTDANTVIQEALSLCRIQHHNEKIKLEENYEKDLPKVTVIPAELEQVFLNLLSNAFYSLDSMPEKKDCTPTVTISINSAADRVNILISDNGGGVPEDQAKFIFDPFYTTKPSSKGTGLGLSISKDIMEKFHGGLVLHNKPGESATFEAWLPIVKEEEISKAS